MVPHADYSSRTELTSEGWSAMKIHGYGPDAIPGQPGRTDGVAARQIRGGDAPPNADVDQLRLSSSLQVMQAATAAARQAPQIRQDVVARMGALLDAGEIGRDPGRIADAMIDAALETPASKESDR
jgi:flagellar biosynthesis anti-sigma factor FlgM